KPRRPQVVEKVAKALGVEVAVLVGEAPIPDGIGRPEKPNAGSDYQLSVRLDGALRNAFELAARRYGVSVSKIAQLAPLMFVILAEVSLARRSEIVSEVRDLYEKYREKASAIPYH